MSALSSLLVQDQVVAVRTIEEALQRQVIFGGQLDTNLLELRAVDEDLLSEFMARVTGLPAASREDLEEAEPQAIRLLTRELAERYGIVPLRLHGRRLRVVLCKPPRAGELEEVSAALGVELEPSITTELRLRSTLSRYYGSELPRRFGRLAGMLVASPPARVEPRQRPATGRPQRTRSTPPPPSVERSGPEEGPPSESATPLGQRRSEPVREAPPSDLGWGAPSEVSSPPAAPGEVSRPALTPVPSPAVEVDAQREAEPPPAEADLTVLSPEEGIRVIEAAGTRDAVLRAAVRVAGGHFEYAAFFTIKGKEARGRAAFGPGNASQALASVSVPLDMPGVLSTVASSRAYFIGPVGEGEANGALLRAIRRPPPSSALVIPILLRSRVVALLYADNGDRGVSSEDLTALLPVASRMSGAFERLILTHKRDSLLSDPPRDAQGRPRTETEDRAAPPASSRPRRGARSSPEPEPALRPSPLEPTKDGDGVVILLTEVLSDPVSPPPPAPPSSTVEARGRRSESSRAVRAPAPEEDADEASRGEAEIEQEEAVSQPAALDAEDDEDEPVIDVEPSQGEGLPSVIVDMGEDIEQLVQRALGEGADAQAAAAELAEAGEAGIPCLVQRFPGPVHRDWKTLRAPVPAPQQLGRVLALLYQFGDRAVPYLSPLLGSGDPKTRFFVVALLGAIDHPDAVESLGPRLLDLDRRVARLAASVLPRADAGTLPDSILEGIRGVLSDEHANELHVQRAAEAAGELRDPGCVPLLIDLLRTGTSDQKVGALKALRTITGQEFGNSVRRWSAWWARARHQHRVEWLIDALDHRSERVRGLAAAELRELVPLDFGYLPEGSRRERERSRRRYQQWWRESGRKAFLGGD